MQSELEALKQAVGEYPPGHFHSPLPDMDDVRRRKDAIWPRRDSLPGIDLRDTNQLALLQELIAVTADHPFHTGETRFRLDNEMLAAGDALVLHGMLRLLRPRQVLEIGSGFSSANMLDTDERFLDATTSFTFVDPHPERLYGLVRDDDLASGRVKVIAERIENVADHDLPVLEAGDLLFIDSSHVAKIGSDVNRLLLDVVPSLPAGVYVHVHDIPWPFEYWPRWVEQGRYWNEAYVLRALLIDNAQLEIVWFSAYMEAVHGDRLAAEWPAFQPEANAGASIWLVTRSS